MASAIHRGSDGGRNKWMVPGHMRFVGGNSGAEKRGPLPVEIFSIHHMAATGGSVISQAFTRAVNAILLSEVSPYNHTIRPRNPRKDFNPTAVVELGVLGSQELSRSLKRKFFLSQFDIMVRHAAEIKTNLVLRDHTHSSFLFKPEPHSETLDLLESYGIDHELGQPKAWHRPVLTVRHPLDSYLSARKHGWHKRLAPETHSLDEYCANLLVMQETFVSRYQAVEGRYEDFCLNPGAFLSSLGSQLCVDTEPSAKDEWHHVFVTGSSGRSSSDITLPPRQMDFVDMTIREEVTTSHHYLDYCRLNGYSSGIEAPPIEVPHYGSSGISSESAALRPFGLFSAVKKSANWRRLSVRYKKLW